MPKKDWERAHRANVEQFVKNIQRLYFGTIREAVRAGLTVNYDKSIPFEFSRYPALNEKAKDIFQRFADQMLSRMNYGTQYEWNLSAKKNDELVDSLFKGTGISKEKLAQYKDRNLDGLQAFQDRKVNGMNLSERVWKITDQFKTEIELALDQGLAEGRSAHEISLDMQGFLNEPDNLFRRIRNNSGSLILSKAAKASNPGQGVYRSSYKNSNRMVRTEINMAYRASDHQRWNQLDFVVGFEIRRSNHPYYCVQCESMVGRYPKWYKFIGWHPQCRCYAIPILVTREEMDRIGDMNLEGKSTEGFRSVNEVSTMPEGFTKWIDDNKKRILRAKTTPYYVRDNFKEGNLAKGIKFDHEVYKTRNKLSLSEIQDSVKKNSRVTSEDLFQKNGDYIPQRQKLHSDIINDYVGDNKVKSDTIYMLGGAPANGKSTLVDSGLLPHPKGVLVIDPDQVKAKIPEYSSILGSSDKKLIEKAANFVHEESSLISKGIRKKVFDNNLGVVIDGVNDGGIDKVEKTIQDMKKATGKRVRADYVSLDTDLSVKLAQARAEKTGRTVPIDYIKDMNSEISHLVPQLVKRNVYDELYLWDTNTNGTPRLVMSMIDGKLNVADQKLYDQFLKKAKR